MPKQHCSVGAAKMPPVCIADTLAVCNGLQPNLPEFEWVSFQLKYALDSGKRRSANVGGVRTKQRTKGPAERPPERPPWTIPTSCAFKRRTRRTNWNRHDFDSWLSWLYLTSGVWHTAPDICGATTNSSWAWWIKISSFMQFWVYSQLHYVMHSYTHLWSCLICQ